MAEEIPACLFLWYLWHWEFIERDQGDRNPPLAQRSIELLSWEALWEGCTDALSRAAHNQQSSGSMFCSVIVQETGWSVPHWDKSGDSHLARGKGCVIASTLQSCQQPSHLHGSPNHCSGAAHQFVMFFVGFLHTSNSTSTSVFYFSSLTCWDSSPLPDFFGGVFLYPRLVCLGPLVDSISQATSPAHLSHLSWMCGGHSSAVSPRFLLGILSSRLTNPTWRIYLCIFPRFLFEKADLMFTHQFYRCHSLSEICTACWCRDLKTGKKQTNKKPNCCFLCKVSCDVDMSR